MTVNRLGFAKCNPQQLRNHHHLQRRLSIPYGWLWEPAKVEKLRKDFDALIRRRPHLIHRALSCLAEGWQLSPSEVSGG
jgi:hypothetical protein